MANVDQPPSGVMGTDDSSADSSNPSRTESTQSGGKLSGLFPDLSTVDWYLDPRFQRYWKHYHKVMDWYKKHVETYEMLSSRLNSGQAASESRNFSRFSPYANLHRNSHSQKFSAQHPACSAWSAFSSHQRAPQESGPKARTFSMPKAQALASSGVNSGVTSSSSRSDVSLEHSASQHTTQEEFEMEITDEMVEFFEQSRKHKQQREEARKHGEPDTGDRRGEDHIDVEKVSRQRPVTTLAPTERPGLRRTQEMKLLYGKGAAMIHGMETATQMTFDRNTDLRKPKLWPNMPLKIVFS